MAPTDAVRDGGARATAQRVYEALVREGLLLVALDRPTGEVIEEALKPYGWRTEPCPDCAAKPNEACASPCPRCDCPTCAGEGVL